MLAVLFGMQVVVVVVLATAQEVLAVMAVAVLVAR
jgi:hypothetical protein